MPAEKGSLAASSIQHSDRVFTNGLAVLVGSCVKNVRGGFSSEATITHESIQPEKRDVCAEPERVIGEHARLLFGRHKKLG